MGTTDFFFRKDVSGDRILNFNAIDLFNDGEDLVSKDEDTSLLLDFFKSRMNLILSIFKIQLEAETNNSLYKEQLATGQKSSQRLSKRGVKSQPDSHSATQWSLPPTMMTKKKR